MSWFTFFIGFLVGVLANYTYDWLRFVFSKKKSSNLDRILRDQGSWITTGSGPEGQIYFYEKDPDFSIKIHPAEDSLASRFKKFPDRSHDKIAWVEVKYKEATLFGCNFMYLDGSRFFLPVPKVQEDSIGEYYDYYDLDSREIEIFNIIGSADITSNLSGIEGLKYIAGILKIIITDQ